MQNLQFEDILQLLSLGTGMDLIWSIFLYLVFFLGLITIFTMPDKNMIPTLLTAAVLLFAIIAKVSLAASDPILGRREFGMMVINVGIAVLPFLVAGTIRAGKGRKSGPVAPAILGGIFGTIYMMMYLIFVIRA
ncbi:MAG: hypothetical protein DIU68_002240 [Chloroflexota bacterium]|nr:MAG: hypothetical protein DIU68_13250 [Chloroflexota bacterium]